MTGCLLSLGELGHAEADFVGPQANPVPVEVSIEQREPALPPEAPQPALEDRPVMGVFKFEEGKDQFAPRLQRPEYILEVKVALFRADVREHRPMENQVQ